VRAHGESHVPAAIAAQSENGSFVIASTHSPCRRSVGDIWPGVLDRVGDASGLDAQAVFAVRSGVRPRAVLAFEPQAYSRQMVSEHDAVDPYVAGYLGAGFALMGAPMVDVTAPLAPGWVLGRQRRVGDPAAHAAGRRVHPAEHR